VSPFCEILLVNKCCFFNEADLVIGLQSFSLTGRVGENNAQADAARRTEQIDSNSMSQSGTGQERLPTPASLAEVIRSSRQLLTEQVAECLLVCYLTSFYLQNVLQSSIIFWLANCILCFSPVKFSCLWP